MKTQRKTYKLANVLALLACIASRDPQSVSYALHAKHGKKGAQRPC